MSRAALLEREKVLSAVVTAIDNSGEVVDLVTDSLDLPAAFRSLSGRFGLDAAQADAVLDLQVGQLTAVDRERIRDELAKVRQQLASTTPAG